MQYPVTPATFTIASGEELVLAMEVRGEPASWSMEKI